MKDIRLSIDTAFYTIKNIKKKLKIIYIKEIYVSGAL